VTEPVDTEKGVPDGFFLTSNVHRIHFGRGFMWLVTVCRYKLKDDVRESMYDACNEWTSTLRKSGRKFMGGDRPNLADLVTSLCLCVVVITDDMHLVISLLNYLVIFVI